MTYFINARTLILSKTRPIRKMSTTRCTQNKWAAPKQLMVDEAPSVFEAEIAIEEDFSAQLLQHFSS
jgi:hypothetical protein